jgi:hypothetical protein
MEGDTQQLDVPVHSLPADRQMKGRYHRTPEYMGRTGSHCSEELRRIPRDNEEAGPGLILYRVQYRSGWHKQDRTGIHPVRTGVYHAVNPPGLHEEDTTEIQAVRETHAIWPERPGRLACRQQGRYPGRKAYVQVVGYYEGVLHVKRSRHPRYHLKSENLIIHGVKIGNLDKNLQFTTKKCPYFPQR